MNIKIKVYHTYKIKPGHQDPRIADVLELVRKSNLSDEMIAKESGVSVTTLGAWRSKLRLRARNDSLEAVIRATGHESRLVRPKHK